MMFKPIIPAFVIYMLLALLLGFAIFCVINKKLRKAKIFRRLAIVALLLIAFARPGFGTASSERELSNINVFFVFDNTGSMVAKDINNGEQRRYKAAANDIDQIVSLFPGSKYGVTLIDYNVHQALPLVSDATTVKSFTKAITPKNSYTSKDSDLGSMLKFAEDKIQKYTKRYPERNNILIVMSDGEDSSNKDTVIPSKLNGLISGGAVIGYGTTEGSPINRVDYAGKIEEDRYVRDSSATYGSQHISKLDEGNLQNIAAKLGLHYYRRNSSNDIFSNVNNFASESAIYQKTDDDIESYNDIYWIFVIIAAIILFWEFAYVLRELSLERKVAK